MKTFAENFRQLLELGEQLHFARRSGDRALANRLQEQRAACFAHSDRLSGRVREEYRDGSETELELYAAMHAGDTKLHRGNIREQTATPAATGAEARFRKLFPRCRVPSERRMQYSARVYEDSRGISTTPSRDDSAVTNSAEFKRLFPAKATRA